MYQRSNNADDSRGQTTRTIRASDISPGMRLTIMPEHCPVTVINVESPVIVRIAMPAGDQFSVPLRSLRLVGGWRNAGFDREVLCA